MTANGGSAPATDETGTSRKTWLLVAAAIVFLTLLGFFTFPGRTFLQSDTQIYMPILEHFWDQSVFGRELLAKDPHVSFTIYDETAIALRRVTGLDFHGVLLAQQLVFRALGLLGIYLIATSLGLRLRSALLVTAVFSLGATILGPAVLTIEYEPVPRGFAVPLLILAIGLVAHGRDLAAGMAAALAFLYHPPSVLPFWAVYFALTLWPAKPAIMSRRILGLAPMLAGVVALLVMSRAQHGVTETQDFFSRIGPELERVQRLRASYNWVSLWPSYWFTNYAFLWMVSLAAYWRVRKSVVQDLKFFLLGLPVFGLLMIPLSYLLLERMKWIVIPQVQPARAVLFVVVTAMILAAVAAIRAAAERRWWESVLWMLPVYAVPVNTRVLEVLIPDLSQPLIRTRFAIVVGLALLTTAAAWTVESRRRWALAPWAAAILVPVLIIPTWGRMRNYATLDNPELRRLSTWGRTSTDKDAMFFFPDASHDLSPGVFRATSLRALYVDWKAGGQANFLKAFAHEWWSRWEKSGAEKFVGADMQSYRALGIDYIVLKSAHRIPTLKPAFENARFVVYAVPAT